MIREALSLYLVTNSNGFSQAHFLETVEAACQGGVTLVQLREKEASTSEFYEMAQAVKQVTDSYDIPLIINDRVDICLAVDAAGVHIGDDELPVSVTRSLIGPDKWLGVSAKTVRRGLEAKEAGADYLGVGAIFPTTTKVATSQLPLETLTSIVKEVNLPVVAIGGLTESKVPVLEGTGVDGIAIVSEIMGSEEPKATAERLKNLVTNLKGVKEDDN